MTPCFLVKFSDINCGINVYTKRDRKMNYSTQRLTFQNKSNMKEEKIIYVNWKE